jgi:DNA-binding transcriptional regulator YiaG
MTHSPIQRSEVPNATNRQALPFYHQTPPITVGQKIKDFRLKSRKTRRQLAVEWGISPKTLWGWEANRRQPSESCRKRMAGIKL